MRGDGDGWVACELGHDHWGRHGAAGLLLRARHDGSCGRLVLMQLRVGWSHHGGTWGLLGGARDSHESAVETALREAGEEGGIRDVGLHIAGVYLDDHGGWSYATVVADVDTAFPAQPANAESDELRWIAEPDLTDLPLHPHFAASWPSLRRVPAGPLVVVDVANVMGSRPDGWWRDRLGAARRLRDRLATLPATDLTAEDLFDVDDRYDVPGRWRATVCLVVEGAAAPLAAEPAPGSLEVVAARGSGDDAIVDQVRARADSVDGAVVVVTSDRELRQRCEQVGGVPAGPRWLESLLAEG